MGMWWPFSIKKENSKNSTNTNRSLKNAFNKVKKDIKNLTNIFETHKTEILTHKNKQEEIVAQILSRLEKVEDIIFEKRQETEKIEPLLIKPSSNIAEHLTEKQLIFCQVIAALQKESPNQWISLKMIASELYPDKKYHQIRSMISQYTTLLDELGIIKHRYKGRQAYVMATQKNPYFNPITNIKAEEKKNKKSK